MATADLLPLFPLDVVLFPEAPLPLHIFEPRYREMIGEAIEHNSQFGVLLVLEQKLTSAGCTAIVERVTKRYEDGRFDIETRGVRRFTILEIDQSRPCLQGRVEFFDDELVSAADPDQVRKVLALARQVIGLQGGAVPVEPSEHGGNPSFVIAGPIRLDLRLKQRLLIERSESERLVLLEKHLSDLIPGLLKTRRAQRVAGSNGHAG